MIKSSIVVFAAALAFGGAARAAPLEAYGKLPGIEQAAVSPGGVYVAYVATDGETRKIAIATAADRKLKFVAPAGQVKLRDIQWAGDDHLIITTSTTTQPMTPVLGDVRIETSRQEFFVALDLDLKTGRTRGLLDDVQQGAEVRNQFRTMNTAFSPPVVRLIAGKPVAFLRGVYFTGSRVNWGLFRVDLDGDKAYLIDKGGSDARDWVIGPQGQPAAQTI